MLRRVALAAVILLGASCVRRPPPLPEPAPPRVAVFTPIPEPEAAAVKNPHRHGDQPLCQRCHEPGAAGVKKDPISLCADCHDAGRMKHVFRVEAPVEAVGKVPLMPGRLIACHTCHDPHDVTARRAGLRMRFTDLCLACHSRHDPKEPGAAAGAGVHGQH